MRSNQVAAPVVPLLRVRLLGVLQIHRDGVPLPPLESARAESLLAYLLLRRGTAQSRQQVAYLLWPDSTESQARTNLRHVLHNLRRGFPDAEDFLEITPRTLRWRAEAPCALDVAEFEALLDAADAGPVDARAAALAEAVERYRGDLLEGRYDEWLLGERERLRQRFLGALAGLAALCEAQGDHVGAARHAERLLRGDPLREDAHRLLMRAAHELGDQARALRAYHVCASTLERELGVAPSEETRRLYQELLPAEGTAEPPTLGPPLVGRGPERASLIDAWTRAAAGHAGFALVTGEPGIGKTRLVEEFARWCRHRGAVAATARCYPAEGDLAYGPVVAWLRAEALRPGLDRLPAYQLTELARLLPELLAERPGLPRPQALPESEHRRRLYDALAAAILAYGGPLLLVIDDLQWCDDHTLRFLHYLLRAAPDARLLVVATARWEEVDAGAAPELMRRLRAQDRLTELELARLDRQQTTVLAQRLAGAALPATETARLWRHSEGNPLFVVEALRAGATPATAADAVPPRVQAVIEARLARLSDSARELAELGAAIGREFTSDVLAAASGGGEAELARDLDELWRRRIVREQGAHGYDFSHDKLRQVAYHGLSPAHRRRCHLRIAQVLRRDPAAAPAAVADHYERAGADDEAVDWYAEAARAAQSLHANAEAVRLLECGLRLLRGLPDSKDRDQRELALLTALPAPLGAIDGYASARIRATHSRAQQLAAALRVAPAPPLLRSLAVVALTSGDFAATQRYGEQLLSWSGREPDPMLPVEAAYVLGIAAFWQARFAAAQRHFEQAVRQYRPAQRDTHLLRYGQDPKVVCLSRLANTLWFLGEPEAAAEARDAALAYAEEIGHPFSRAVALVFASLLAIDMRDQARLREHAAQLAAEADPAPPNRIVSQGLNGYVDVLDGAGERGFRRLRAAVEAAERGNSAPGHAACLQRILLAACEASGDAEAGLAAAERLLVMGRGAAVWEAEARRLREAFRTGRAH